MQLRDNGLGFSPITILLHWVVAALLFSTIGLTIAVGLVPEGQAPGLKQLQNLFGAVLLLVSIYRLWARITSYHPLPVGTPNPVEVIISRSVAVGLALAMVMLPIAAWILKSAAGEPIAIPGGLVIPPIMWRDERIAFVIDLLFNIGATAFLAGLGLHIFGAFKNHVLLKNDTLKRMLGKRVEL